MSGVAYIASGISTIKKPNNVTIPELPTGTRLIFKLISSWGDKKYIGLTALEVFNK